jgi:hypothetical protein
MSTHKYQLIVPSFRKAVDLREYEEEIAKTAALFPTVTLDEVNSDYYQITIKGEKNRVVRKMGKTLANTTSLKVYCRKKTTTSSELFLEKKTPE